MKSKRENRSEYLPPILSIGKIRTKKTLHFENLVREGKLWAPVTCPITRTRCCNRCALSVHLVPQPWPESFSDNWVVWIKRSESFCFYLTKKVRVSIRRMDEKETKRKGANEKSSYVSLKKIDWGIAENSGKGKNWSNNISNFARWFQRNWKYYRQMEIILCANWGYNWLRGTLLVDDKDFDRLDSHHRSIPRKNPR